MNLELWRIDSERYYPPHVLVTDEPDPLRLEIDLTDGTDARLALRGRPHAAVAYVMSSTYRERGGMRSCYYPLIAFEELPDTETILSILNCCKWSERLLDSDWQVDGRDCHVLACRLTERYLLEFIHGLYRAGGFVIPGHLGDCDRMESWQPFHVDLAHGRALGLEPDSVAEIRWRHGRGLTAAIGSMTDAERAEWGLPATLDAGPSAA